MDLASSRWFTEMGIMEEYYKFIDQCETNCCQLSDELIPFPIPNMMKQSFSTESTYSSYNYKYPPAFDTKNTTTPKTTLSARCSSINETSDQTSSARPPIKQLHDTYSWNSSMTTKTTPTEYQSHIKPSSSPSPQILSFEKPSASASEAVSSQNFYKNLGGLKPNDEAAASISHPGNMNFPPIDKQNNYAATIEQKGIKRCYSMTRTPEHAQDHIIAERKRREKLSQRFIALSALLPGLKKMDKASVLGDAIKYVKQLQERVKSLEEQKKRKTVESVVLVKKSQLSADDESSSCHDSYHGGSPESVLPDIEVRASDKEVLIRIHCEKQQGILLKILSELEDLHLSIVNSSVLAFGNFTLDITIIAQMENEFLMTVKDLVKNLRLAFLKFM